VNYRRDGKQVSEKEEQLEKDLPTAEEPLTEPSEEAIDAAGLSEAEVEKSEIDLSKRKEQRIGRPISASTSGNRQHYEQETVMSASCCRNIVHRI
jgi:hypothetical protein